MLILGLLNGTTRNAVAQSLVQESKTLIPWVRQLSDLNEASLLFCNWPFATSSDLKIQNLEIKSFLNLNGTINSRSKFIYEEFTQLFLLQEKSMIFFCIPDRSYLHHSAG